MTMPQAASRAVLLIVLLVAAPAGAQPAAMPADWLASLTVRDAPAAVSRAEGLLTGLRVPAAALRLLAVLDDEDLNLAGREVTVGVAAPAGDLDRAYVYASAPTPVIELVQRLGGDMTGDIGLVTVLDLEFAAREVDGLTRIVQVAHQADLLEADSTVVAAARVDHDLTLTLSEEGIRLLRRRVLLNRENRGGRRLTINNFGWPPSVRWLDIALGANAPLADRLMTLFGGLSCGVSVSQERGVTLALAGQLREESDPPPPAPAANPVLLPQPARPPILTLTGGNQVRAPLQTLLSLALAYAEGRPDEIEAAAFPPDLYAALAEKIQQAAGLIDSLDGALLSRNAEDPFYSNQVVVLKTSDAERFRSLMEHAVALWNQIVVESDAGVQLRIDATRAAPLADGYRETSLFTSDVGAAFESPTSPEVRAIMQRYYGADGRYVMRLAPFGDDRVLLTDVPQGELPDLERVRRLPDSVDVDRGDAPGLRGVWRVDRYSAWQNAILSHYMADAIGFAPLAGLAEAPVGFSIDQPARRWTCSATASEETAVLLGRYLLGLNRGTD